MSVTTPLEGLRVLELAGVLAGPVAGMFLAELGADVIKVENPATRGDVTRGWRLPEESSASDTTAYFHAANWGKRSIAIDISAEEGRELVRSLSRWADVVLASYRPGQAESLGVGGRAREDRVRILEVEVALGLREQCLDLPAAQADLEWLEVASFDARRRQPELFETRRDIFRRLVEPLASVPPPAQGVSATAPAYHPETQLSPLGPFRLVAGRFRSWETTRR